MLRESGADLPAALSKRAFYQLLVSLLALCAIYAAVVLNQATYAEAVRLSRITFHNGSYRHLPVRVSEADFLLVGRSALGAAAGLGLAAALLLSSAGRRQARKLAVEIRSTLRGTWLLLASLTPAQRRAAALSLAGLTVARLYFSVIKSYHPDEVASYDLFISQGLLAVSSFYPIPNNHVLSNTLSWAFFQLSPDVWFTLRLPVLLTSTAGTVVLFAGLLRFGTFRIALVALTLFSWMQLSFYYAVAGRGYWLLMTLAGIHFFATVALLYRRQATRVAWLALLLSGILGCYTVPSFVYVVVSSTTYAAFVFLRRRDWQNVWHTVLVGAGIVAGAALLYAPLLLLSGWRLLLANDYVVSQPWADFVMQLPAFLWFTEGTLAGQRTIGAVLFFGVLLAFGWLRQTRRWAALPPDLRGTGRRLAQPALWFVLLPYALLTAQRVLPPERVLLYKALYFFVVLSWLLDVGLRVRPGRWWPWLAGAGLTLFVAYQTYTMSWLVAANRRHIDSIGHAFTWLQGQPPGRTLVSVNETALHFLFFAHTRLPRRPWQLDSHRQPGVRYRYVIVPPGYQGPNRPPLPARPAYQDAVNEIYVLSLDR